VAKKEISSWFQMPVKGRDERTPGRLVEVDHDVPAEDHVERTPEGEVVTHEIDALEEHALADRLLDLDLRVVFLRRESALDDVTRLLDARVRVDTSLGGRECRRGDVARQDDGMVG
jgi:hypothetical protein